MFPPERHCCLVLSQRKRPCRPSFPTRGPHLRSRLIGRQVKARTEGQGHVLRALRGGGEPGSPPPSLGSSPASPTVSILPADWFAGICIGPSWDSQYFGDLPDRGIDLTPALVPRRWGVPLHKPCHPRLCEGGLNSLPPMSPGGLTFEGLCGEFRVTLGHWSPRSYPAAPFPCLTDKTPSSSSRTCTQPRNRASVDRGQDVWGGGEGREERGKPSGWPASLKMNSTVCSLGRLFQARRQPDTLVQASACYWETIFIVQSFNGCK